MASSSQSLNSKWLLTERNDDYKSCQENDPQEYFAGLHVNELIVFKNLKFLYNDLGAMGIRVSRRRSLIMP